MAYDGTAAPGYTNAGYSQDGMNMWTINQDVPSPGGVQQSTESLPRPIYTIRYRRVFFPVDTSSWRRCS